MDKKEIIESFKNDTAPSMAKTPIGECVIEIAGRGEVISKAAILNALRKILGAAEKPYCWTIEAAIEIISQASGG